MDNLTHSLVGALLGQAGLKRKTGLAMPALIIGANLPDVDAACLFWLDGLEHVGFRRGITHGPPAMVLLPLVLAGILWSYDRWQAKRGARPDARLPVKFSWLYLLSLLGCLTHPALDWLNVYGVRLLEPFSSQWFYGDTLFIIDVWLWAMMGLATWLSLRREREGGNWLRPARIALTASLVYIGMNGIISWRAESWPAREAQTIANPIPFAFWSREVLVAGAEHSWLVQQGTYRGNPVRPLQQLVPITDAFCVWPDLSIRRRTDPELEAFLFWSRAPFAERAPDGSVLLRDARFYDPRARDRFTIALPDLACEPIEETAH